MTIKAKSVKVLDQYKLEVVFVNNEIRQFDVSVLFSYPVYKPLRQLDYFMKVFVSNGVVQWPNEEDISPDLLYIDSLPVDFERQI